MGANYRDVAAPAEVPTVVQKWFKHRYERMGQNDGYTASDKVCKQIISHLNSLRVYDLNFRMAVVPGESVWNLKTRVSKRALYSLEFTILDLYVP